MEKNEINIIKESNSEEEWESIPSNEQTEETKDVFYRLNFERASKVKLDIHKLKNFHSLKMKKLDIKEKESFYNLDKYIKEKYIPNISLHQNYNTNPYITILNNDYLIKKNPEIGTCLIYELNEKEKEAKLIGKSDTWYESTIFKPKLNANKKKIIKKNNNINNKINKTLNFNKKIKKEKNKEDKDKNKLNNKNENNNVLKKKRKRRKKSKYIKNSTVIEIKRIFDKPEINNINNDINTKEEKK